MITINVVMKNYILLLAILCLTVGVSENALSQSLSNEEEVLYDASEFEATPEEMAARYKSKQWERFLFPYSDRNSKLDLGGGPYYLLELSLNYWFIILIIFSCIGILVSFTERKENYSSVLESIKTFFRSIFFGLFFSFTAVFISFCCGIILSLFFGAGTFVKDEIITLDVCECEQKRKDRDIYDYQLKQCQDDFGDSYFWESLCCLDKPHYCK